jgi:hypothetical protein
MASIEELAETLRSVAAGGMKPKALLAAVRDKHPEATKKEVIRAAFYALTETQSSSPDHLRDLHDFAITERAPDDVETIRSSRLRKKKRNRKARSAEQSAH